MSRFALEKYRIFPIFAWIVCISFTIFVYSIVQELRASTEDLAEATTRLEVLLSQPPSEITDFSR